MDKDQEQTQNQGEFEVKEQDRWLPIANGQLRSLAASLRKPSSGEPATEEVILDALRVKKESLMKEVYTILTTVFGAVPSPDEKFIWEATCSCCSPKENWEGTPKEFYEQVVLAGRYNVLLCPQKSRRYLLIVISGSLRNL